MASIYTTVDVDVDIEIDEFVDSCSERELKMLVRYLQKEGYLNKSNIRDEDVSKMTSSEIEFCDKMSLLSDKFYQMTIEDSEIIEKLYEKYR
jgi:hypothetical protein